MMTLRSGFLAPFLTSGVTAAIPVSVSLPDFDMDELTSISPALSALSLLVASVGFGFVMNAILTPEEKIKRKRRGLVSRIHHPSRSKFKGAARCFRQRFDCRRLRWA